MNKKIHFALRLIISLIFVLTYIYSQGRGRYSNNIYDMDAAIQLCSEVALDNTEGIWVYPEDHVTVLILKDDNLNSTSNLATYLIRVIESDDCRLNPGDIIGTLQATPDSGTFKIELFTEKQNHLLLKPVSCLASQSKDKDTLIIKRSKSPVKFRLNLNFNRLLTGFWKIASIGMSQNQQNLDPPVGMVKIYPSYDGNGSSRRSPRYL